MTRFLSRHGFSRVNTQPSAKRPPLCRSPRGEATGLFSRKSQVDQCSAHSPSKQGDHYGLDPLHHSLRKLHRCRNPLRCSRRDLCALPKRTWICASRIRPMASSDSSAAAHDPFSRLADPHGAQERRPETLLSAPGADGSGTRIPFDTGPQHSPSIGTTGKAGSGQCVGDLVRTLPHRDARTGSIAACICRQRTCCPDHQ